MKVATKKSKGLSRVTDHWAFLPLAALVIAGVVIFSSWGPLAGQLPPLTHKIADSCGYGLLTALGLFLGVYGTWALVLTIDVLIRGTTAFDAQGDRISFMSLVPALAAANVGVSLCIFGVMQWIDLWM